MTDADGSFERVDTLLELGRPADALPLAQRVLAEHPDNAAALVLLAKVLLGLKQYPAAEDAARRAVTCDPDDVVALSCLAAGLWGQQRLADAAIVIRQAVALAPDSPGLRIQQANIALAAELPDEALCAAQHARRLDPHDSAAAVAVASAHIDLGQRDDARAAAVDALRLDPHSPDAHHVGGLARLHFGGGGRESVARFREALRLDPQDPAARAGLTLAVKTRNPLYRAFFLFQLWLERLSNGQQWAVRLAPFVIVRVLSPVRDQPWAVAVLVVVGVFVALTWLTEPIANLVLLAGRRDRRLVERLARTAALLFLGFAVAAGAALVVAATTDHVRYIPAGIGLTLWAAALGISHTVGPVLRRMLFGGAALIVPVGIAFVLLEHPGPDPGPGELATTAAIFAGGVIALAVCAFAPKS